MAGLAARTDDVERQLLAQTAETEALSGRIHGSKAGSPTRRALLPSAKPRPPAHAASSRPPANSRMTYANS